ncbi:MAG: ABC transporter ATP-binding protein [Gemmatimonadetes bacterium]|jgi:lipoprotein-releasing system ATP-binding protein|nr:ABC transporter ATP-binding protein [Gemmatimonadota bacterium]
MSERHPAVVTRGLSKSYVGGDGARLDVLEDVDLEVAAGESIAVLGQSGAGKSTLLHLLGGLDRPTSGEVWLGEQRVTSLTEDRLARLRTERIGFVFQFHHLLREFTALENVMMPQLILGVSRRAARDRALSLLEQVGLERRVEHKPAQLSGGEQQRVAVARALANRPVVLLADEPTGNLDPHTSDRLHDLLFDVSREHSSAMILVTHNLDLAARADRVLRVHEARLIPAVEERVGLGPERYTG